MVVNSEFEYAGECIVCDEPVDHRNMGICHFCGNVFHWGECGTWDSKYNEHKCNNCED